MGYLGRMSFRTSLAIAAALSWWLGSAACSSGNNNAAATASTAIVAATGSGGGSGCNGFHPDGYCVPAGPAKESCACLDCATTALCTNRCKDDGKCDLGKTEDCTCADCYFKVQECSPGDNGCNNDDKKCTFDENCVCKDCTATDACTKNCVDNGVCVPWLEGCSCADCKKTKACGGGSTTTTTTTTGATTTAGSGGAGGVGGAPAVGGAGGV